MCLIAFAYQQHPDYPLVVIANRDESYARPTATAAFWQDQPDVLAGRDLQAQGTWLGITRQGRFAAVTNYREAPATQGERSRGELTGKFLTTDISPTDYYQTLTNSGEQYSGYNLLFGTLDKLYYFSNRSGDLNPRPLEPGVYSLSNHLLNSPWPKAELAKQQLAAQLKNGSPDLDSLVTILQHRETYPDEQLPETGLSVDIERVLSSAFIVTPEYGTRSTTALVWNQSNQVELVEQNYQAGGELAERKQFAFSVESDQ